MAKARRKPAAPRARRPAPPRAAATNPASPPPSAGTPAAASAPETRECWLCSKPLDADIATTSMLGQGVFEVHRRCYEESLGIRRRI